MAQDALDGFTGIAEPIADAVLSFPISGILSRQYHAEGDVVAEGQPLCELQSRAEELEVARRSVIVENAKLALSRTRRLFEKTQAVSQEELDEKEATVKVAEAELAIAEEDLHRRRLTAPFSGVIASLYDLGPGEGVELLTPVARLVDSTRCLFVCNVPAHAGALLTTGTPAAIQFGAVERRGTVRFVSPVLDPSSGLRTIKVVFENGDGAVLPGASGILKPAA